MKSNLARNWMANTTALAELLQSAQAEELFRKQRLRDAARRRVEAAVSSAVGDGHTFEI